MIKLYVMQKQVPHARTYTFSRDMYCYFSFMICILVYSKICFFFVYDPFCNSTIKSNYIKIFISFSNHVRTVTKPRTFAYHEFGLAR